MAKDKKLWIDGCMGSELKDTQGETLSVEGADIAELEAGRGRWNDNHGKGFFNSLGRITEAKKIFKAEDCENDRQRYYWEKIKAPYIYGKGYLYNDEDHPNARAAAAILRNIHREDSPLKLKMSVEGGVMARGIKDPTRLARTKIHSCALTFTPANNATLCEPLNLDKSNVDWEADKQLIKSVMHLAETNVPSFRHITRHASAHTIYDNINRITELAKSIGVDIEVKDFNPEQIMEKAVLNKIASNVSKINALVKAAAPKLNPVAYQANKKPVGGSSVRAAADEARTGKMAARDNYQQQIGKLKGDPTTPQKPLDTNTGSNMVTQNANKVKHINTFKTHASKAMRDPKYLENMHSQLTSGGVHPDKVNKIISSIKSHMQEPVAKSEEVEKGDLGRAAKNLVLAGAMGMGVHHMGQESKQPKDVKPKKQIERSIASTPKKSKEEKPKRSKEAKEAAIYLNKEILKQKLKKALTAGYGGAGAPTDLTGGGVIQAESLDDGRNKSKTTKNDGEFQYVTCDECGNEQVYMQHQVKCRKCRKNFNMDKLKDLM